MSRKQLPPRLVQYEGNWYVAFSEGGRSQRTSLRTQDIQVAQSRFQGWLKARSDDAIASEPSTLAGAWKLYVEQHGPTVSSPESLEFIGKTVCVWFGERRLTEITRLDIERYTKARLSGNGFKRPVSAGTVRKELTILRAVFKFMCDKVEPKSCRVNRGDLSYIPLPARPPARNRVLSEHELALIRREITPTIDRISRINRYLWLLMETGARSEALRTLQWDQVNLNAGLIQLNPWGRNQTTKRRPTIPISDDLLPILLRAKHEATGPYVLDHPGQIRKSMETFCRNHQLNGVTAHTFRHTLATRMAQAGVAMAEIAAMLGDTMATVEKNYLHLSPQFLRGALAKLKSA
jgi:integrase